MSDAGFHNQDIARFMTVQSIGTQNGSLDGHSSEGTASIENVFGTRNGKNSHVSGPKFERGSRRPSIVRFWTYASYVM